MVRTRRKAFNFPAKNSLYFLTAAAGTGLAFQSSSPNSYLLSFSRDSFPLSSSIFTDEISIAIHGFLRSLRAISTVALTAVDFKYSLHGLTLNSEDYHKKLSEVHLRSAKRVLELCQINKGFYAKAGQFAAAMRQVPKEYTSALSSLQDQAVPCPFEDIKKVLINNLGQDLSKIFLSFDERPIAAASIAQVHRAMLKDRQEVAIKVQYPGLEQQMKIDMKTMYFISNTIASLFPEYRFHWLASEFAKSISMELDFIQEARNSERTARNLKHNNLVKVPRIYWVDDIEFMKQKGINPSKVAKALVEVFAEMIFIHGFLHGDPHPGNILVCPEDKNGFSLVLLDHGIYKQLDEEFRVEYCQLWKALILLDSNKIQQLGEQFGIGKYSRYFPVIFTGRTIDSKSTLGVGMSIEEGKNLKQELKSLRMEDISSFMESLPNDFLTILRTDGLLRSILRNLGVSQQIRMLTYAKYALYGLSPKFNPETDSTVKMAYSRLKANASYFHLRLVLGGLELLSKLQEIKQRLHLFFQSVLDAIRNIQMISFG